jgi:mannose-1-phosphate guanylyltransferase
MDTISSSFRDCCGSAFFHFQEAIDMNNAAEDRTLWSVILAGGEGQRMRPLIQRWLGSHRPKQYCTFVGGRSMFQHTLDRADMLISPAHRVTVAARSHRADVLRQIGSRQPGKIILQPANRDTAAGIFLALSYIRAQDPGAIVAVFPSDHFVYPDGGFIDTVRDALQALNTWGERIILLGAVPDRPDPDYGWIQPGGEMGSCNGHPIRSIQSFVEKPSASIARQSLAKGGLWNTLVFVANAEALWNLGRQCFRRLTVLFEKLQDAIGSEREDNVLQEIYKDMPMHNFSSELLARVNDQVAVIKLRDVRWSDWGRPERIVSTLGSLGKRPAFPRECLWSTEAAVTADQCHGETPIPTSSALDEVR